MTTKEKMDWADKKALELMLPHVNCEVSTEETCRLLAETLRETRDTMFLAGVEAAREVVNNQGQNGIAAMLSDLTKFEKEKPRF